MQIDQSISDFEKDFLRELNDKMFPISLQHVREDHHQQTKSLTTDLRPLPETNVEISASKLIVYEQVYLLPEEV